MRSAYIGYVNVSRKDIGASVSDLFGQCADESDDFDVDDDSTESGE